MSWMVGVKNGMKKMGVKEPIALDVSESNYLCLR